MKVSVLFSGGKDSSLSAFNEPFLRIELGDLSFGLLSNGRAGSSNCKELRFPHRVLYLKQEILEKAYVKIMNDGFPKSAIIISMRKQ